MFEMKSYPKILGLHHWRTTGILDNQTYLQNKYHGSNMRFMWLNEIQNDFMIGTRDTYYRDGIWFGKDDEEILINEKTLQHKFYQYVIEHLDEFRCIPFGYQLFGEFCGKQVKATNPLPYDFNMKFFVFDVYDHLSERFLPPLVWEPIMRVAHLEFVDSVYLDWDVDTLKEMVAEKDPQVDVFEGYVVKHYSETRIDGAWFTKIKSEKHTSRPPKEYKSRHKEIVLLDQLITKDRVGNRMQYGFDELGHLPEGMVMMTWLPKLVWEDVEAEEISNFTPEEIDELDMRFVRKSMSGRVATLLKEILSEM